VEEYQLLIDLHKRAKRQGPGGDAETKKAIALAGLDQSTPLKIADIGCGTGAASMLLARSLNAQITAVDFLPDFIDVLKTNTENAGLSNKIGPLVGSMESLPFDNEEFDVIWSEGAIYNMGFENGINDWKRFLKPGGLLVVSEITWTTNDRPLEVEKYWQSEYPGIDTASSKISILENNGYSPVAYFILPEQCWLDNYYRPMQNGFTEFIERNANNENAQKIVETEKKEISLYKKYKNYYSYGVYIASKLSGLDTQ
jgi:ubiquinone/menaquinone biosynthesis C-methylase UbiE